MRAPLLAGELIHLSRAPRTWAMRAGFVVFLAAAAALAWPWSGSTADFRSAGETLFKIFFWTEFIAGIVLVPAMVAPAIAWEKERGTLDLLSVAPVTDFDIVFGKLLANSALTAATLAAGLPIGVAALLLGGTTPLLLLTTTVGLILHGLFAASVSILMSASSDRAGTATGLALVTLIAFAAMSTVLGAVASLAVQGIAGKVALWPVFSLLCPWTAAVRDALVDSPASWLDRGLAWTAHLAESAGALAIAATVLRNSRSPRGRSAPALAPRTDAPAIPMAFFAPSPAAAGGPIVPIPLARIAAPVAVPKPPVPPPPRPPAGSFAPVRNYRLPILGNPVYWKDRAFDDSTARQVLTVFGALVCGGSLICNAFFWIVALFATSSGVPGPAAAHVTLVFDLLICLILAIGAGSSTLGPERDSGTLPILLSTGLPVRDILAGKLLAALRSIAPALVVALAHAAFCALTMGALGPLVALAFVASIATAFTLACAASLAVGHPRRAASVTTGALFALWAVPALSALPFRDNAAFLTSLNPFGIILRSVSVACQGTFQAPHFAAFLIFLSVAIALTVSCVAGAVAAMEARVRA